MPNLIWLEWEKDTSGHMLEEAPAPVGAIGEPERNTLWLRPKGGDRLTYRPLDQYPALFMEFADTDPSNEALVRFADEYGEIHWTHGRGEPIQAWYDAHQMLKHLVGLWERRDEPGHANALLSEIQNPHYRGLAQVQMTLYRPRGSDALALHVAPKDLLHGMLLQFLQAVSSNTLLRCCAWCPKWFVYGTGTGRRKSAHYCSDRCRKAAHRAQKEG